LNNDARSIVEIPVNVFGYVKWKSQFEIPLKAHSKADRDRQESNSVLTTLSTCWSSFNDSGTVEKVVLRSKHVDRLLLVQGFKPIAITNTSTLNASSASAGALELVNHVHDHTIIAGLDAYPREGHPVGNALV
jgi:hypothetical protein